MFPLGSLYRVHDGVQGTNKFEVGTEENPMNPASANITEIRINIYS
jgi:hypothetical protein